MRTIAKISPKNSPAIIETKVMYKLLGKYCKSLGIDEITMSISNSFTDKYSLPFHKNIDNARFVQALSV